MKDSFLINADPPITEAIHACHSRVNERETRHGHGPIRCTETQAFYACFNAAIVSRSLVVLQIEGAFVMGMGLCTMEEILIEPKTGKLLSDSTWTYKIPTAADIPRHFNVTFLKDSPNIRSVMSSKASGEPSMMLSMSVLYALRRAVLAAKNSMSEAAANSPALPKGLSQMSISSGSSDEAKAGQGVTPASEGHPGNDKQARKEEMSTSCVIDDGANGNPFLVLEAPVTTCHGKEAVGQFSIVEMLKAAVGKTAGSVVDLEYHSSGEWVVVH